MKNTISDEQLQQLAEVANLYYELGLDQSEIAAQLNVSRSSISRLLTEARELGVVEFRINFPLQRDMLLEEELVRRFKLTAAQVLNTKNIANSHILQRLGRLAAIFLMPLLRDDITIGLTWGTTLYEVVASLPRQQLQGIRVVQVIGASGSSDPLIDGTDIARQFAERVSGQYFYLHSPLIVENIQIRDAILSDPSIRKTLEVAQAANILITGIGTIEPQFSAQLRAVYITEQDLELLKSAGAVGEFCGYFIDRQGQLVETPHNSKIVGISPTEILQTPTVIGIAAGVAKAPTTLAALRGRLVNMLVVDDQTARQILHLDSQEGYTND